VLRRLEEAVRDVRATDHDNSRAFLDLLVRVLPKTAGEDPPESGKLVSW
jgi:hypothetical protein